MKAHQDDSISFTKLSRNAKINCICNHTAKQLIAINGLCGPAPGRMLPLKPIGIFVNGEKITSKTGGQLRFWAHP
jgi:hypothetical protein